jgi:sugar phosphate isomerase/epimerase
MAQTSIAPVRGRLICRPGSVGRGEADVWTLSPSEPGAAWLPRAATAFDAAVDQLMPRIREGGAGAQLIVWPGVGHALSDVPSTLSFLRKRERDGVGVLVDPASLLTAEMFARAEEHLERIIAALAGHPSAAALLVANVVAAGESTRVVPLGAGAIDAGVIERAIEAAPASLPRVVLGADGGSYAPTF